MSNKTAMHKINLHIIEACNYRCRHCFAKFHSNSVLPINAWKDVVDNCLASLNVSEFNIAGGEPLLYKDLLLLVQYIKSKDCECSIVTNGSLLTDEWIIENAKHFKTIGISVDSFYPTTLMKMGRIDFNGNYVSKSRLQKACKLIKDHNPDCKIKINSVTVTIFKRSDFNHFPFIYLESFYFFK